MNFNDHVKTATTFQKLSHDDQLMLQLVAREGLNNLGDEFLRATQLATYNWLTQWKGSTSEELEIVAELLELQRLICSMLGGDTTNMHS